MQNIKFTIIATNCFKMPLLRNVFFGCLIITIVFTAYSTFVIIPSYTEMLIENKVDEAIRTGRFLSTSIIKTSNIATREDISNDLTKEIDKVKTSFNLYKLKIFSGSGEIIFSSNQKEIGEINTKDYFRDIVAKGKTFTKVVKKNSNSLEGKLITSDVAEIYIPIMNGNRFKGAFEIYYNITRSKKMLDNLLNRSKTVLYTIASTLFIVTVIFLLKTSKALIERRLADEALQQAHDKLEERVAEQTYEIQITQKTSIEALAVLAEYNDTDTGGHLNRIQEFVKLLVTSLRDNSIYSKYLGDKCN